MDIRKDSESGKFEAPENVDFVVPSQPESERPPVPLLPEFASQRLLVYLLAVLCAISLAALVYQRSVVIDQQTAMTKQQLTIKSQREQINVIKTLNEEQAKELDTLKSQIRRLKRELAEEKDKVKDLEANANLTQGS